MAYKRSRQTFENDLTKRESPYVLYGTPLPPLDSHTRDDGSFVPIWKQEVTDDRGRKRLHGAFTGGFSAGYYNTVGSKEGWTPSAFVSSRQKAAKGAQTFKEQRVEDFMDEEDLREAEESSILRASETFAGFGTQDDPIHRDALMDIFRPTGETMGVKLLKRMGWKEGQGIGPRIKRAANVGGGSSSTSKTYSFAPEDTVPLHFDRKTDPKGLGYNDPGPANSKNAQHRDEPTHRNGDPSEDEQTGRSFPLSSKPRAKKKPKRTGFGVGVLNDTGSDDEDPYSMGPKISYNRTLGGDKSSKKKASTGSNPNPMLRNKPVFLSKKLTGLQGALRKCHDGKLPLDGFVLADDLDAMASLSLKNVIYKPPQVPSDWQSSMRMDTLDEDPNYQSVRDAANASHLDAKGRASLLGEAPLPVKSVFDFISPAARDRLALASGKGDLPPGLGTSLPSNAPVHQKSLQDLVPKLDQQVALQALNRGENGWMPYAEDEKKRGRYKAFLEIRGGLRSTSQGDELPPRAEGVSQEDWILELQEFSRAAEVFKPVSGLMASRFTSSTSALPQSSDDAGSEALLTRPQSKPEDPAESAARMGMFGHLTRTFSNFYPTRLLCKRIGVPMPNPATMAASTEAQQPVPTQYGSAGLGRFESGGFQNLKNSTDLQGQTAAPVPPGQGKTPQVTAIQSDHPLDPDRNEALEQQRPGESLFKAIFGSDDEDGDD